MFQLEEDLHLYHGFHSGGNGFLLSMKTAKRNKSIHNFLCYFGIILSNPFFSFFDALREQFCDGIEKVYQRAFLDVQLLSLLWLITSHSHIPSFFGVMVLISAFESSGVLIEGAMSSSHSVTTLR